MQSNAQQISIDDLLEMDCPETAAAFVDWLGDVQAALGVAQQLFYAPATQATAFVGAVRRLQVLCQSDTRMLSSMYQVDLGE